MSNPQTHTKSRGLTAIACGLAALMLTAGFIYGATFRYSHFAQKLWFELTAPAQSTRPTLEEELKEGLKRGQYPTGDFFL